MAPDGAERMNMEKPIITKVPQNSEHGSCNYCKRGKLREDGFGLEYPYDYMMRVEGTNVVVNFCPDCWKVILTTNPVDSMAAMPQKG